MFILLLLAGLILLIAGGSWFAAATAVGIVLIVFAVVWFAATVSIMYTANKARKSMLRDFNDRKVTRPW